MNKSSCNFIGLGINSHHHYQPWSSANFPTANYLITTSSFHQTIHSSARVPIRFQLKFCRMFQHYMNFFQQLWIVGQYLHEIHFVSAVGIIRFLSALSQESMKHENCEHLNKLTGTMSNSRDSKHHSEWYWTEFQWTDNKVAIKRQ